jgi:hypothetical protein
MEIFTQDDKVYEVYISDPPQCSRYQWISREGIEQINGKWFAKYKINDLTDQEIKKINDQQENLIRSLRNEKLKSSDWTQVLDAPVDKTAWATYRQALRDIPSIEGFPWDFSWPDEI